MYLIRKPFLCFFGSLKVRETQTPILMQLLKNVFKQNQVKNLKTNQKTKFEFALTGGIIITLIVHQKLFTAFLSNQSPLLYLAIIAVILYYSKRMTQLKSKQFQALNDFKDQVSEDLHDEVGSILAAIAMQSELQLLKNKPFDPKKMIQIQEMSYEAMSKMRDIVWTIHSEEKTWSQLGSRLQDHAHLVLEVKNVDIELSFIDIDLEEKLDSQTAKHFFLIAKEAITNIAKHSNASKAELKFEEVDGRINMEILDNGSKAVKVNTSKAGIGFVNMRNRARKLGATLKFKTNKGFCVQLCL